MNQEMPKQESPEEYQKRVVSEEAREAFEKVEAGKEAESVIEEKKNQVEKIKSEIKEALAGDPFLTQDPEKASEFLKSMYAKIKEGSELTNELKNMGAPETDIKRFEKIFDTFREEMARGEDTLAGRVLGNIA